ncbi:MAG: helix-turn-helix domain-containing protein [Bacteroidales bacterium]|nr:helix-turn-helix domain-containing protein [Bacteroidales bacterium]
MAKKQSITDQLRDLRKQRGMTQQELADKAGTTRQWIVYIESGKSSPTLATLKPILKALNAELLIKDLDSRRPSIKQRRVNKHPIHDNQRLGE